MYRMMNGQVFWRNLLRLVCVLWLSVLSPGAWAKGKSGVDCWIEASAGRKTLYAGDSCVVNYQLFSNVPFSKVVPPDGKELKAKNATVRLLGRSHDFSTYRVRRGNHIYYTAVIAQYMVAATETGTCRLPELRFKVEFYHTLPARDLWGQFFGERRVQTFEQQVKAKAFSIEAVEKPRRSMQEMLRQNKSVI